jgi:hypothetical protein
MSAPVLVALRVDHLVGRRLAASMGTLATIGYEPRPLSETGDELLAALLGALLGAPASPLGDRERLVVWTSGDGTRSRRFVIRDGVDEESGEPVSVVVTLTERAICGPEIVVDVREPSTSPRELLQ